MASLSYEPGTLDVSPGLAGQRCSLLSPKLLDARASLEAPVQGGAITEAKSAGASNNTVECRFAFLLLPGYSSIYLASAIHVLNLVNQLSHRKLYRWEILSKDGLPLATSEGLDIGVQHSIDTLKVRGLSSLIVCGGSYFRGRDKRLIQWLHRVAEQGADLGAISTGSFLLAEAGLLNGYRCTTHWQYVQGLREEHPRLEISSQLFVIDRNRFTCSGGSSVLDLMMHIVSRDHGDRLAALLSESLVCERVRAPDEPQRVPLRSMLGHSQPRLAEAIALMEANIEEPIPLAELACYTGVSARHLERLFRKHLDCSPSRHYRELRLKHAHRLLWQTGKTVTEIAFASGFNSIPHFCKNFREYFGHSPSISRRLFNTKVQGARA